MREPKSLYMDLHTVIHCAIRDTEQMTGLDLTIEKSKLEKYGARTLLTLLDGQLALVRAHLANENSPYHEPLSDTRELAKPYKFSKVKVDVIISGNGNRIVLTKIPTFLSPLWRRWLVGDCEESFACLYAIVSMCSKWSDPSASNPDMLSSYEDQQKAMTAISTNLDDVRSEINRIIPIDIDPTRLLPAYGPEGASYNHIRPISRLGLYPSNLRATLTKCRPHDIWVTPVDCLSRNRPAQVPKTWNKDRLIFVEEEARLNVQQAIRVWLEDVTAQVKPKRFDFKDQEFQRSRLGLSDMASIDLSAASDTISAGLVFSLFQDRPVLRSLLFGTRARTSDGPAHRCYSTMGNATTFPIMTIILSAVCASTERSFMSDLFGKGRTPFSLKKATVFGDDIVCDQHIMPRLLSRLKELGLCPNPKKTYGGRTFKESCGLDIYKDVEVTPLRVSNLFDLRINEQVVRLVDLSNRAHRRGFWTLADYVLSLCRTRRKVPFCFHEFQIPGAAWSFSNDQRDYTTALPNFRWDSDIQSNVVGYASSRGQEAEEMDSDVHLNYFLATGKRLVQVRDADEASRIARQSRGPFNSVERKSWK